MNFPQSSARPNHQTGCAATIAMHTAGFFHARRRTPRVIEITADPAHNAHSAHEITSGLVYMVSGVP